MNIVSICVYVCARMCELTCYVVGTIGVCTGCLLHFLLIMYYCITTRV